MTDHLVNANKKVDPRLAALPPEARAIVEEFLRVHEAEGTVFTVDPWQGLHSGFVTVCWNHLGEFGIPSWASLTVRSHGRDPHEWRAMLYESDESKWTQPENPTSQPVTRDERTADFLRRFVW